MSQISSVLTIDLNFLEIPGAIACYLIPHAHGAVLIEAGPGSTISALKDGLRTHGFREQDISDVLLTHIHLDHAGAAGWLARQGANIYVHPKGASHLLDPEKLITSARRVYGERMDTLWGEFLPVPYERLRILQDNDALDIEGLHFRILDTPGHADHHLSYLFDGICFSGDVGGVRLHATNYVSLPTPAPEFRPDLWRSSLIRLQSEYTAGNFSRFAPTHFGFFDDPAWHLEALRNILDEVESWIDMIMPTNPSSESLASQLVDFNQHYSQNHGLDPELWKAYETISPAFISSQGIRRYWNKYHSVL